VKQVECRSDGKNAISGHRRRFDRQRRPHVSISPHPQIFPLWCRLAVATAWNAWPRWPCHTATAWPRSDPFPFWMGTP